MIKDLIKDLVGQLKSEIINDLQRGKNMSVVIGAYNQLLDDCDSTEFILCITDKKDLKFVVNKGWLGAREISALYGKLEKYPYFVMKDGKITSLTIHDIKPRIEEDIEAILYSMLTYLPNAEKDDAYMELYRTYIAEKLY